MIIPWNHLFHLRKVVTVFSEFSESPVRVLYFLDDSF